MSADSDIEHKDLEWTELLMEMRDTNDRVQRLHEEVDEAMIKAWRSDMTLRIRAKLLRFAPDATYLESKYDLAIIGVARTCRSDGAPIVRVVYDIDRLVQIMIEGEGVSQEHATMWMSLQAGIDPDRAPIFMLAEDRL